MRLCSGEKRNEVNGYVVANIAICRRGPGDKLECILPVVDCHFRVRSTYGHLSL